MLDYSLIAGKFWQQVRIATPNECWEWRGPTDKFGYGFIYWGERLGGRKGLHMLAHRLSWEMVNGPIPDRKCILHQCDRPSCVNINHLFLGTRPDNMRDKVQKDRQQKGERVPQAKLTDIQVKEIRQRWADRPVVNSRVARFGPDSIAAIARDFDVSSGTILNIVNNRAWMRPRSPRNGERMTYELAQQIRERYANRTETDDPNSIKNIAKDYGVNFVTIHNIVTGVTWKHVKD